MLARAVRPVPRPQPRDTVPLLGSRGIALLLRPRRALWEWQEHRAHLSLFPAGTNAGNLGEIQEKLLRIQGYHGGRRRKDRAGDAVALRWTLSLCLSRKSEEPRFTQPSLLLGSPVNAGQAGKRGRPCQGG